MSGGQKPGARPVEGGRSSIAGEMIYEWAEFCGVSCKALCRALAEDFRE